MSTDVKIEESWKAILQEEFEADYFRSLKHFLVEEKKKGEKVYPPGTQIFAAFDHTPFDKVKVVILGQDPYHGAGQAHGLCFSVNDGIRQPPSLQNIFKELQDDCGCSVPKSGNLTKWADQGVLLLNATLTVRDGQAGSHQGKGWETFTDAVIRHVAAERKHIVFILWGKFAQNKAAIIDTTGHLVLTAAHPSPFSAHNGFFGCKHFSATNDYLRRHHLSPIDWQL
jgi:uracil-DNA glycosylase